MNTMTYDVREMPLEETRRMIGHFRSGDRDFLNGMGVDPAKLPSEKDWFEKLAADYDRPLNQREFFYTTWLADGEPIGHCNVNKIDFGHEAYLHLHIWSAEHRGKQVATQLLPRSVAMFFQKFELTQLMCEPYALNPGPNRTLPQFGFELIKSYETTPGWITFHQPVNQWKLSREAFKSSILRAV